MEAELVHNVASDAHDAEQRRPGIADELREAGLGGDDRVADRRRAAAMIAGEDSLPPRPNMDYSKLIAARDRVVASRPAQASFVIAMTMPISTNTTIATCIQIQVGDIWADRLAGLERRRPPRRPLSFLHAQAPLQAGGGAGARLLRARAACPRNLRRRRRTRPCGRAGLLGGVNTGRPGLQLNARRSRQDDRRRQAAAREGRPRRAGLVDPRATRPGQIDAHALAYTDRLIDDAAAHGIGVIAMVDGTPCWASLGAGLAAVVSACPGSAAQANGSWPPAEPLGLSRRSSRSLAERYGNKLTALEVWNEPDQANETLLRRARKGRSVMRRCCGRPIRRSSRRTRRSRCSAVRWWAPTASFLRLLYKAGIKGYYDGLAVHFYTLTLGAIRAIREMQLANGDATPLWLGEFGWTDCYPRQKIQEEQPCVTKGIQALNITNIFRALGSHAATSPRRLCTSCRTSGNDQFGVVTTRGAHKPSFSALSKVLASPFGPLSPGDAEPAQGRRHGDRQRLRAGRRLHAPGSLPGQRAAIPGAVHAEPLQPLLAGAAKRARHAQPARARLSAVGRARAARAQRSI